MIEAGPTQVRRDDANSTADMSCVSAVPGPNGNVPIDACNSYYNYDPQFAPAVAVAILFGVLTLIHVFEAFLFKKKYAWVLIMGGLWETVAFILHALGSKDQQNIGYATSWNILFLLAPLWINAFAYMTFARMMWYYLPAKAIGVLKATGISRLFVWLDVAVFIVQAVGGTMANPGASPGIIHTGLKVYLIGMGTQQSLIVLFVGLMITFYFTVDRRMQEVAADSEGGDGGSKKPNWRALQFALFGVLTCITVRIIYRIAEFAGGITPSNPVPFHEQYSYALDCFPMMMALLILTVWHPGRTLIGPDSEFPSKSRAEKKAEKQVAKETKKQAKADKKNVKNRFEPSKHGEIPEYEMSDSQEGHRP